MQHPLRKSKLVKEIMEWVNEFGEEFEEPQNYSKFKQSVRDCNEPLYTTKLNIYWTRNTCGVKKLGDEDESGTKGKKGDKDVHHISFNHVVAKWRHKTCVAIRAAEMAVSYHMLDLFLLKFQW